MENFSSPRLDKNNALPPIFTTTFTLSPPPTVAHQHPWKTKHKFIYTTDSHCTHCVKYVKWCKGWSYII